jgi:carboxymethylenebutenolidase
VLFPEIFGINEFILDTAHALARRGFVVATPDLYHRTNTAPMPHEDVRRAMKMALTITPETSEIDTGAAIAMLRSHPDVADDRLAAMGYCVGGLLSYASVARRPGHFDACVVFYANGLMGPSPHRAWPDDLLLHLGPADVPVRMFYGGKDDHISTDYVRSVDSQLEALGVDVETVLYEDAGHGFCNSHLPTFDAGAAQDAWLTAMNFLA